ncbi:MAG: type IV conjugative transfer system protein TraL [Candidatus Thiodiazotropha endolucinida]|nr:type IV conjugative transfer system protein TraL [Candidatus Thiodiazotropha taylori]MCW4225210.1 type IV conjugative transfer system protein TraL [Candidatus Thiodiazotropha endolucinida]MCG7880762.1 type IV conjugative transfer system protein TraL [Candidatus Thiodiazotropha taylori]MCG7886781.1 type IV conjugative transfer system protein TraL [Candidatus Thiodiazotropha taylori]MCG8028169.1 type IV conjugative transfer system protein TraL [Candidatus Thiodiazotropha taylori]
MENIKIPRRIDEPPHFLLWSADELAPMLLGLTFGIFIGEALICTICGQLITSAYRKYRDNRPDGYLMHMLYHWGLFPTKSKLFLNPYINQLFP